ncbi:Apolipoprotein N-acyltransferase [Mariprofundus ferrinatatus]|uniref:Apolipoprotein N-acyltransferase n=2 Tax=Mariprofundus ferrinatatus TaxID=1921087 RepID=A0A2K8LDL8_9PROT|nr:Apolipoprotein N-acyltransferase [Mariprofundus ferrinatatus]
MLLALALGGLMPFAFSPYDYAWLAIPALAGFLWLICQGMPFRIGYAFGFGWFGLGAWWLAPTLHTYGHLPWVVAGFCVILVGAVMALLPALWAWITAKSGGRSHWIMVTFPIAAVGEEWLRGHIFTGLPWTALGNLMLDTPAIGWASWFGVYGLALIPSFLAASLLLVVTHEEKRWGAAGVVLVALLMLAAPEPFESSDRVQHRAGLIQGNIPQDKKWDASFLNETMNRYADLSAKVADESDVIIWPEAAIPFFLERAPQWNLWLSDRINWWRTPLLFGGLKLTGKDTANNGLFAEDPALDYREFAGKQHLVPFGEYVPSWVPFLRTLVPEIANFEPAEDSGVVELRGIRYGALICYESLFPEQSRQRVNAGAGVLVNVTNDAWYGTSPAAWQHFQAARMRAVETGRYVLRVANTGVTAIIGPDGRVMKSLPWWSESALTGEFSSSDAITPYVKRGDAPLLILLVLIVIPLFVRKESI